MSGVTKTKSTKNSQQYPPCAGGVYSLRRFFMAVESSRWSDGTLVTVGGRVAIPFLVDEGGRVELPKDFFITTKAQNGDTWCVTFSTNDFEPLSRRVRQIVEAQCLTKSRQDVSWSRPDSKHILAWGPFVDRMKSHLRKIGLQEVETPTVVQNPGMEPELEPFCINSRGYRQDGTSRLLYLATSPELHLKQLLTRGYTDIYEIKTVYRKEELTPLHEPEFHMLEWYRGYANLDAIADDLNSLLKALADINENAIQNTTIRELFRVTGFDLKPDSTASELLNLAKRLQLHPNDNMDWNDLFHLIWIAKVEPQLPKAPMLVRDYPPLQAALARINSFGWADRLEFYWQGIEVANAFHELNDPTEQRKRFISDQKKRVEYGRTPLDVDENFMQALEFGMPPSGGIALGVDRLFMLVQGASNLRSVRAFGWNHQL